MLRHGNPNAGSQVSDAAQTQALEAHTRVHRGRAQSLGARAKCPTPLARIHRRSAWVPNAQDLVLGTQARVHKGCAQALSAWAWVAQGLGSLVNETFKPYQII